MYQVQIWGLGSWRNIPPALQRWNEVLRSHWYYSYVRWRFKWMRHSVKTVSKGAYKARHPQSEIKQGRQPISLVAATRAGGGT